jgi:uncharacterized membrane protein YeiH
MNELLMDNWSSWVHIAGTLAFATTAVLAVAPRGIDLFGAVTLGIITAIGGGTIRDIILQEPVFWANDQFYIWLAAGASVITFYANSLLTRKYINMLILHVDAIGVSLFAIQATHKVWKLGFAMPFIGPLTLGIITAIGGGLIRDVLAGRQTLLMSRELYAIPVMLGCVLFILILNYLPAYDFVGSLISIALIYALRAAAIHKNLSVPNWMVISPKEN